MGALASTDSLADMEAGSYRGTPPFPNPCAETRGSLFASALKGGDATGKHGMICIPRCLLLVCV